MDSNFGYDELDGDILRDLPVIKPLVIRKRAVDTGMGYNSTYESDSVQAPVPGGYCSSQYSTELNLESNQPVEHRIIPQKSTRSFKSLLRRSNSVKSQTEQARNQQMRRDRPLSGIFDSVTLGRSKYWSNRQKPSEATGFSTTQVADVESERETSSNSGSDTSTLVEEVSFASIKQVDYLDVKQIHDYKVLISENCVDESTTSSQCPSLRSFSDSALDDTLQSDTSASNEDEVLDLLHLPGHFDSTRQEITNDNFLPDLLRQPSMLQQVDWISLLLFMIYIFKGSIGEKWIPNEDEQLLLEKGLGSFSAEEYINEIQPLFGKAFYEGHMDVVRHRLDGNFF